MTDIDIRAAAAPRSDQTNYEALLGGPRTVRVAEVKAGSKEQPIEIHYEGGDGKPYKPCKSMLRVLIAAWGDKGADWIGRSMTLYGDHEVVFGGVKIGGIRISHVSHIEQPISVLLSTSRGKRKPYLIHPLTIREMPAAEFADVLARMAAAEDDFVIAVQRHAAANPVGSLVAPCGDEDAQHRLARLVGLAVATLVMDLDGLLLAARLHLGYAHGARASEQVFVVRLI